MTSQLSQHQYAESALSERAYFETEQSFQQQRVEEATPLELTCILYEGAIQGVEQAQLFLRRGEILARGRAIARAQGILLELIESLDRKKGGDMALRLGLLYDYALTKLAEAHRDQRPEPLVEVQRLLSELHSAWKQITPQAAQYSAVAIDSSGNDARLDLNA